MARLTRSYRPRRLITGLGLATAALLAVTCAPVRPAAPEPTARPLRPVKVHLAAQGAPYAHHLVAIKKGYYAEEGLEVELITAAGTQGVAAVVAGEVHITTSGSTALSAILKGADMKVIFTHNDSPGYQLWSGRPDVRSLADLPGKSVGVNARGDAMELSTRMVLQRARLDPESVSYVPLGPTGARLAALQSGAVAAAILGIADAQKLREAGPTGHQLADISTEVKMLFNGAATSGALLRNDPDLVFRFLRATIKGREYVRQHREPTLEIIGTYNGASVEVNAPDYDVVVATMTGDGTLPLEVQRADAAVRASLIGAEPVRPIEEMYAYELTLRAYDELRRSGWKPRP